MAVAPLAVSMVTPLARTANASPPDRRHCPEAMEKESPRREEVEVVVVVKPLHFIPARQGLMIHCWPSALHSWAVMASKQDVLPGTQIWAGAATVAAAEGEAATAAAEGEEEAATAAGEGEEEAAGVGLLVTAAEREGVAAAVPLAVGEAATAERVGVAAAERDEDGEAATEVAAAVAEAEGTGLLLTLLTAPPDG